MHTNEIDIESFVKRELEGFEFPYDYAEWQGTENKLKQIRISKTVYKTLFISSLSTVLILVVLYFTTFNETNVLGENINSTQEIAKFVLPISPENELSGITYDVFQNEANNCFGNQANSINEENKAIKSDDSPEKNKSTKSIYVNNVAEDKPSGITTSKTPIPYFSISQKKGCAPLDVTCYPYENSDSMVYYWEFGDGKFSNEKFPKHEYQTEGIYYVRLTLKPINSEKVLNWQSDEPIEVLEKPMVDFEVVSPKNPYEFRVLTNPTLEYLWDFGDAAKISGNEVNHVFVKEGNFQVTLTGVDENGCKAMESHNVNVKNLISVLFPDAFTPDGDGFNDFYGPVFSPNEEIVEYSMQIFNEFGMMIFSSSKPELLWDGKIQHSNHECEMGIYHAVFRIRNKDNIYKEYKSKVTLLK